MKYAIIFLVGVAVGWMFWVWKKGIGEAVKGPGAVGRSEDRIINPEQVEKRKAHLDKVMELAGEQGRVTNDDLQKALGVSDATATRYLEELEKSGRLVQVGEKGKQVYYQIPSK